MPNCYPGLVLVGQLFKKMLISAKMYFEKLQIGNFPTIFSSYFISLSKRGQGLKLVVCTAKNSFIFVMVLNQPEMQTKVYTWTSELLIVVGGLSWHHLLLDVSTIMCWPNTSCHTVTTWYNTVVPHCVVPHYSVTV